MVSFECCPNRSLQLPLGQLRRIGTLADSAWTKEEPKTPCRLVDPNFQSEQATVPKTVFHVPKVRMNLEKVNKKNPLMIVEMIANKKDRKRVANYLNCDLEGGVIWNLLSSMVLIILFFRSCINVWCFIAAWRSFE
jgi:hypothetical protein